MLKKTIHISLAALLFLSTIGVTVHRHFCFGSFVSETIFFSAENCCGADCNGCRNESQTFKITDNFEAIDHCVNLNSDIKRVLKSITFAFILLNSTLDFNALSVVDEVPKICNTSPIILKKHPADLQVFRL